MSNNTNAASIVILAGSIVYSAGMIAAAMKGHAGPPGSFVGGLLILVGGVVFAAGVFKPFWDAVPVDGKKKEDEQKDHDGT